MWRVLRGENVPQRKMATGKINLPLAHSGSLSVKARTGSRINTGPQKSVIFQIPQPECGHSTPRNLCPMRLRKL